MSKTRTSRQFASELLATIASRRREYLTCVAKYIATRQSEEMSVVREQLANKLPDIADIASDAEVARAMKTVIGASVMEILTETILRELNGALAKLDMTNLPAERLEEIAMDAEGPGNLSASFYQLLRDCASGCEEAPLHYPQANLQPDWIHELYAQVAAKLVREIELEGFRAMPQHQAIDLTFGSLPNLRFRRDEFGKREVYEVLE